MKYKWKLFEEGAVKVLYLGGGGGEKDSKLLDQLSAQDMEGKRPSYLPIAMNGFSPTYRECQAWIQTVFNSFGITDIVIWDALPDLTTELQTFDAVYIGGGNTYKLLRGRTMHSL